MDVGLPEGSDGCREVTGSEKREAGANIAGQNELCVALPKPAVLSQAGNATEEGAPGAGVQTRELDGAIHPDEH